MKGIREKKRLFFSIYLLLFQYVVLRFGMRKRKKRKDRPPHLKQAARTHTRTLPPNKIRPYFFLSLYFEINWPENGSLRIRLILLRAPDFQLTLSHSHYTNASQKFVWTHVITFYTERNCCCCCFFPLIFFFPQKS